VQEAAELTIKAFDTADKYRTPVMVLLDGMLGQMMEPVGVIENKELRVENEKPWAADGNSGNRARNVVNSLSLRGEILEEMNLRRFRTYEEIKANEVMVDNRIQDGDEVALAAYGTPARIILNAVEILKSQGIKADLIRPITLWPYPYAAFQNLPKSVKHVLVCELSMGQMIEDVKLEVEHFGRLGGIIPSPIEVLTALETKIIGA
jgi:2-oxoglutarate ferredoxin oxidoreductase subunit alpha